ncbi:MAG: hypothetical protein QNK05_25375 [Myxococcota bacterium]|nr:hypothetical protein [Myxococcota bacterium]
MGEADKARVTELFTTAAEEFRRAAAHLDVAAKHFERNDIPRGCAHAFAAQGHQSRGSAALHEATRIHADHSNV